MRAELNQGLIDFLRNSPTPFHATRSLAQQMIEHERADSAVHHSRWSLVGRPQGEVAPTAAAGMLDDHRRGDRITASRGRIREQQGPAGLGMAQGVPAIRTQRLQCRGHRTDSLGGAA